MPTDDFLKSLLDVMNRRLDTLDNKLDINTSTTQRVLDETQKTNSRVAKSEHDIEQLQALRSQKTLTLNPNAIYILALSFLVLLTIIATVLHINVGNLLK